MNLSQGMDSKFRMILVAAKRARQLQAGAKPLLQSNSKKPTRIAQQEVSAGRIPYEVLELKGKGEDSQSKGRKKKAGK